MKQRMQKQLNFIVEIDKMKNVLRRTVLTDKSRRENDAEHSWHIAVMAMILEEYADTCKLDMKRVLEMLLVHDLVEIYAGDTFAFDTEGNKDKEEREKAAANKLFAILPMDQGNEIRALWEEFELMETTEAQYAASLDRLQPFIHNYLTEGHTWRQANATKADVLKRMDMVRIGTPNLWGFVEDVVAEAVEKGYIQP